MIRMLGGVFVLLMSLPVMAASQNLATIRTYFVDFQSDIEVGNCKEKLIEELEEGLIKTTSKQSYADALYVVLIEEKSSGLRKKLVWKAAVYTRDSRVLFSDSAEEAGWNAESACIDAVADIADELADEVRKARVNRGRFPEPRYTLIPDEEPGFHDAPAPTVAPVPIKPRRRSVRNDDELREKVIDTEPPRSYTSAPGESTTEPSKWRKSAEHFARVNGCSEDFSTVQSLPSGAEVYTTTCGRAGKTIITCSSGTRCDLSF